MDAKKFFKAVKDALENWEFDLDPEEGEIVKAGLEKILAERLDLSANVAESGDEMWEDINFQARWVMGEA
jgi:hypothetical protein